MFARLGTMVMLLPGLGEMTVSPRVRLTIALVLTAVIMPLHRNDYQIDLRAFGPVLLTLGQELLIGVVLGLLARLTIASPTIRNAARTAPRAGITGSERTAAPGTADFKRCSSRFRIALPRESIPPVSAT